ncbi:hypothetical protein ROA7450_02752 [Roseovarius albus]|uniref:Uncharacterized protein n=1 Tax=Roseovarius albus TaxID=1247867 RepID=A0A1X6ZK95_9RHOB|nr:hypothetical protein [Roseovarius albus]SLN53717.1 hypothetical protein ROA7450_02752 [Roseovarius albus]
MTALEEYDRIEAAGLWRPSPDVQRTDAIASIGDATLVITDLRERPLAHWSLPAVCRANPGELPAVYHPDGDPGETLELAESEHHVIEKIEQIRSAIERKRPHPGRLRLVVFLLVILSVVLASVFWLPGALRRHAVAVLPEVNRAEIGSALLERIQTVSGAPCNSGRISALEQLAQRVTPDGSLPPNLLVMRDGVRDTASLPGNTILVGRNLLEDFEEPSVVAGYLITEQARVGQEDPLEVLLRHSGVVENIRLLTTGNVSEDVLQAYAEDLLTEPPAQIEEQSLLAAFEDRGIASSPYAYALDVSGESTLGLIEADPLIGAQPLPILSDADWLRLQGLCGG